MVINISVETWNSHHTCNIRVPSYLWNCGRNCVWHTKRAQLLFQSYCYLYHVGWCLWRKELMDLSRWSLSPNDVATWLKEDIDQQRCVFPTKVACLLLLYLYPLVWCALIVWNWWIFQDESLSSDDVAAQAKRGHQSTEMCFSFKSSQFTSPVPLFPGMGVH